MEGKELIASMVKAFFDSIHLSELLDRCPNHMLWEAIGQENALAIAKEDIASFLSMHDAFFVLPEPLPAIQNGLEPEFVRAESTDLLFNDKNSFESLVCREPTYLVSCDFKWMIVLTTENTAHGAQLCVIVRTQ